MNAAKVIEKLVLNFANRVIVRSQYHIQVTSENGSHDIWMTKDGELRFKAYGDHESHVLQIDQIIKRISSNKKSNLDLMREMLNISKFIEQCDEIAETMSTAVFTDVGLIEQQEKSTETLGTAVFTDAGLKGNRARIAAVFVKKDGTVEAQSQVAIVSDIQEAEVLAINLGLTMSSSAIVFNDNQFAVSKFNDNRVKWLARSQTKIADNFANLRKRK